MNPIQPNQLLEHLNWRYAVKRFDPTRRIDGATWQALEQALILSPSSYGLQPWKFIVISDEATKEKLPAISWNQSQPRDCSHMVVFAARESLDAEYVDGYMQHTIKVRGLPPDSMSGYRNILVSTIERMESHLEWNTRQVYIALGQLMVAAAMLEIDTCAMEGIQYDAYDELLGLKKLGYRTVVGCAVGYRHPEDLQASAAKVRFDADTIIHRI